MPAALGPSGLTMPSTAVASATVVGQFVSQKVFRVRWMPVTETRAAEPVRFVAGSWDDAQDNSVTLWECDGPSASVPPAVTVKRLAGIKHKGDVSAMEFLTPDAFVTGSSEGSVKLMHVLSEAGGATWRLDERAAWDNLHGSNSKGRASTACRGVSCFGGDTMASVGEDGQVFALRALSRAPLRAYEKADSCSLTGVIFIRHDELLTSNNRGQLRLLDLRAPDERPSATFALAGEQVGVTCVCRHPVQAHIVCSGGQSGGLCFWDLRSDKLPLSIVQAHQQAVSEVSFHPRQPDHMFSCSESGDVWHWDGTSATSNNFGNQYSAAFASDGPGSDPWSSAWYARDASKHRVETTAVLARQHFPINSLDFQGTSLIVGGDNESVYVVRNVLL